MRYYSTQRPFGPGTFPQRDGTETITNFDGKIYCEEIGREVWGFIEYREPLTKEEADAYELTLGGMKTFWCVTTTVYDSGRVAANITSTVEAVSKPENDFKSTKRKDIYHDWFESQEDAENFVKEAEEA